MAVQRIIGVDFGTSTSVIRVKRYENGKPAGVGEKLETGSVVFNGMYPMVPTLIQRVGDSTYYGYDAQIAKKKAVLYQGFKVKLESEIPEEREEAAPLLKNFDNSRFKAWKENLVSPALLRGDVVDGFSDLDSSLEMMGVDVEDYGLNRKELERFAGEYLRGLPQLVRGCIREAGIRPAEVELVILTGGHSQWYFTGELLAGKKPEICEALLPQIAADPGRIILISRPQETVALGLAYQKLSIILSDVQETEKLEAQKEEKKLEAQKEEKKLEAQKEGKKLEVKKNGTVIFIIEPAAKWFGWVAGTRYVFSLGSKEVRLKSDKNVSVYKTINLEEGSYELRLKVYGKDMPEKNGEGLEEKTMQMNVKHDKVTKVFCVNKSFRTQLVITYD